MTPFNFLGTWDDSWGIVAAVLDNCDLRLVPDLLYDQPKPVFITELDDAAKEMLLVKRNGFFWSTKFSRFPPTMIQVKGGEAAGKYFVSLLDGGPYLRLVLPGCYEEGGVLNLGPGSLSYPNWTTNPMTNVNEKASPELRAWYKEVKAVIKQRLVRLKVRPDIWSGRDASRLVEEGRARVHGFQTRTDKKIDSQLPPSAP